MKETTQSLSHLWALLRTKEEQFGLEKLSLTERDILQSILYLKGKNKIIGLDTILNNFSHPRATLFRCLKKLREKDIIKVTKDTNDARKTFISVIQKFY
jgi:DNA-binding MarR family transcriptional regulator